MALLQACKNKDLGTIADKINRYNAIYVAKNCDDDPKILGLVFKISKLDYDMIEFIAQNKTRVDILYQIGISSKTIIQLLSASSDNMDIFQYIYNRTPYSILLDYFSYHVTEINYNALSCLLNDKETLSKMATSDIDTLKNWAFWDEPLLHNISDNKINDKFLLEYCQKYPEDIFDILSKYSFYTINPEIIKFYNPRWSIKISQENIKLILQQIKNFNDFEVLKKILAFEEAIDYVSFQDLRNNFRDLALDNIKIHPTFIKKYHQNITYFWDEVILTFLDLDLPLPLSFHLKPYPIELYTVIRLTEKNISVIYSPYRLSENDIKCLKNYKKFDRI